MMKIFRKFPNLVNSKFYKLTKMKIAVATSFQNFPSNLENMADSRKIFRAGAIYLRGRGEFYNKNEGSQSKISCVFLRQGRIWQ